MRSGQLKELPNLLRADPAHSEVAVAVDDAICLLAHSEDGFHSADVSLLDPQTGVLKELPKLPFSDVWCRRRVLEGAQTG